MQEFGEVIHVSLEPNHLTDPSSAKYWPQVDDPHIHSALVLEIWFTSKVLTLQ